MDNQLHDEPSTVEAAEGEVLVDGPNGVSVSLTPEAALETAERLEEEAIRAKGQLASEPARRKPV